VGNFHLSTGLTFNRKFGPESPDVDIVFIHGLTGDPQETWTTFDDSEFWPNWLETEFPNIAVYSLGYPASLFQKWANKEMDIYERATSALDIMVAKGIGERPIIFIVHSLGGILLKQIIRSSDASNDEDIKAVGISAKLNIFLATPHKGAMLASVLECFFPKLKSPHIDLLTKDNGALYDLNNHYRSYAEKTPELSTIVYYETHLTKKVALVVDRSSADPGVVGTVPVATDKCHTTICKPVDHEDVVYLGILRHIKKVMKNHVAGGGASGNSAHGESLGDASETDRRDLLTKMIDADRETEYSIARLRTY